MEYAYTVLNTKDMQESDDSYFIKGIASTPTPDRADDIVEPMGAVFKTPMPLLWQHDSRLPVGNVTFAKPTKNGIPFEAELPKVKEAGTLKDRIDEAIQSIQYKLVTAVSIGFNAIKAEPIEESNKWGMRFLEWEWLELSLVTIPANSEAVLKAVRSHDRECLAALGKSAPERGTRNPGVAGTRKPVTLIPARR